MTFRNRAALTLGLAAIPVFVLGVPLLMGWWLPDLLSGGRRVLATERLASGYVLQVIQYWNHSDYTTELQVTAPDGVTSVHLLDADDDKDWRGVPLTVDEAGRSARVTLSGNRPMVVYW